jgi:CheY-like chemotaxis protein
LNIFYADDDEDDREIFSEAILTINPTTRITLSKDGQEALETLRNGGQLPNYIFLDINMPRMNGRECLAQLKADSRLKDIPVFITSTSAGAEERNKLELLGAEGFMPKSTSLNEFIATLRRVIVSNEEELLTIGEPGA